MFVSTTGPVISPIPIFLGVYLLPETALGKNVPTPVKYCARATLRTNARTPRRANIVRDVQTRGWLGPRVGYWRPSGFMGRLSRHLSRNQGHTYILCTVVNKWSLPRLSKHLPRNQDHTYILCTVVNKWSRPRLIGVLPLPPNLVLLVETLVKHSKMHNESSYLHISLTSQIHARSVHKP